MADWTSLAQWVGTDAAAGRVVAWRDGEAVEGDRFAARIAAWAAAFAVAPGPCWALYIEDSVEFAAALLGAWRAGKTACLPADRQPATLVRLAGQVDGWAGDVPGGLQPAALPALPASPVPGERRLQVFTSGSSGEPIAIDKRLDQLDAEVHALQAAFGGAVEADGAALVVATVSHQHIYGLLFGVLWPLAAGRPFVSRRLSYVEQLAAVPGSGPVVLVSSPAHLARLPVDGGGPAARARLRALFSSGAPLPPDAARGCRDRLGHAPFEVYGSSETGGIAWRQRPVHGEQWQPLPGVSWRIGVDEVLEVRSDRLSDDGWWPTSDRARRVGASSFELLGRVDRIAKVEGKRISLSAIEQALLQTGEVVAARAVHLPDDLGGRIGVATVPSAAGRRRLVEGGRRAFNDALRRAIEGAFEPAGLPRRWRHGGALPIDTQGKCTEAAVIALFRPTMPRPHWIEQGAKHARATLQVDASLRVFDGHFPGRPVLPGVAQLDWAITLGRICFALPERVLRVEALKFYRPVEAGAELRLTLACEAAVLSFRFDSSQGAHGSGRVVFEVHGA